jgi:flagellar biosynthesis/type III secretory pathway ATPase
MKKFHFTLARVPQKLPQIDGFLRQDAEEVSPFAETLDQLRSLTELLAMSGGTLVRR